jgi:hypothetical protein
LKTRNIKAFDREFDHNDSQTKCYIHKEGTEIPVYLKRDLNKITLSFTYRNHKYTSDEITCNGRQDYVAFNLERIKFGGLDLEQTDLNNLADCIDKMFEAVVDL